MTTARQAVEAVWAGTVPDLSSVADAISAGAFLTSLCSAALDILSYRQLATDPDTLRLVAGDAAPYLRYKAADERRVGIAISFAHGLGVNGAEALWFAEITGRRPPTRSLRIHVLVTDEDNSVGTGTINRLDLDPRGGCRVDWYGPFNAELFTDVALGFALFITHMVANVFDGDDGSETFTESMEYII